VTLTPDPDEISEVLSRIPIRRARDADWDEYAQLFVQLCRIFEIDATVTADGGISYPSLGLEDNPLRTALEVLLTRRLH
jgi:hypothetical protein